MPALRTRPLVEGALLAALVVLLGLLSYYSGLGWVQALPVLVAGLRHGARLATLTAGVGAALLALWVGPFAAAATLGFILATGVVPAWVLRRRAGPVVAVIAMSAAMAVVAVLGAWLATVLWGQNLWAQQWASFVAFLASHPQVPQAVGLGPSAAAELVASVLPLTLALAAVAQAVAVYLLSRLVLCPLGYALPRLHWPAGGRHPAWWGLALVAGLLDILGYLHKVPAVLGLNLSLSVVVAYSVLGCGWLLGRRHRPDDPQRVGRWRGQR